MGVSGRAAVVVGAVPGFWQCLRLVRYQSQCVRQWARCLRSGLCRCRKLVPCHHTLYERWVCRVTPCGGGKEENGHAASEFEGGRTHADLTAEESRIWHLYRNV